MASSSLAAVAVLAAAVLSATPASAAGIFVRSAGATRANEADLVTEGPNHTLQYYFATPGGGWHHTQIAGVGTTYSAPSIFVRAATGTRSNEADIVAEGPNHTLQYYAATPGGRWHHTQIARAGTTYSAPSIFVRAATATQPNEADVVAEGPNHTLRYYVATPGSPWQGFRIAGAGSTYSAPSIFVESATATQPNQADIVAEGPNHTLRYYAATPGSAWQAFRLAGAGSTYSPPSIFVQSATAKQPSQAEIVVEGANHTLQFYWATPAGPWERASVAGVGTAYSAPSIFVRSPTGTQPDESDIVVQGPNHTLLYYLATPGGSWQGYQIAQVGTIDSAPSIFVRSATATRPNEADIVAEGPNHTLQYYAATPGSPWHHTRVAGAGTTYSG